MNKKISDCPGCGAARGPYANTFLCGSKECKDGKVARSTRCEHRERDDLRAQLHWLRVELNANKERVRELEAAINDPQALWANWLRGTVKLPAGIGDVRQYQERIHQLEDRIKRASTAFFADGSDRQAASGMLKILEEERSKQ